MFAGLGAVISQMFDVLKTHHIVMFFSCILLCCPSADLRVQVVAVFVMQFQQPSHMIDTGDQFSSAFQLVFHPQFFQQFLRTYLYAMAQTYGTDLCVSLHIAGQHRHRVGVVEEKRVRADRLHILGEMKKAIDGPRAELSKYAPQHAEVFVNPEVIRMIIGPGGKNIKAITAATGASVDIEDSGRISIFAPTAESMEQAKELVQYYDQRPDLGKNYMGKVRKVLEIGAIVEIMPNVEALVHISQLDTSRVAQASDVAHLGEDMLVKVIEINGDRIRASRKAVLLEEQGIEWKPEDTARPARAPRGEGERDHRGDRGDRGERRERRPRRD